MSAAFWLLAALLPVVLALLLHGCAPSAGGRGTAAPEGADPAAVRGGRSRADIREQLAKLAESRPPKNLSPGAMCYDMAVAPLRFDYVCPTCGEKTLHVSGDGVSPQLEEDLGACRRLIGELRGLDAVLDERALCRHCSPEAEAAFLAFEVRYPGDSGVQRTEGVTPEDLLLVVEFLSGSRIHEAGQGRQIPLKECLPRLEALLGVTVP